MDFSHLFQLFKVIMMTFEVLVIDVSRALKISLLELGNHVHRFSTWKALSLQNACFCSKKDKEKK